MHLHRLLLTVIASINFISFSSDTIKIEVNGRAEWEVKSDLNEHPDYYVLEDEETYEEAFFNSKDSTPANLVFIYHGNIGSNYVLGISDIINGKEVKFKNLSVVDKSGTFGDVNFYMGVLDNIVNSKSNQSNFEKYPDHGYKYNSSEHMKNGIYKTFKLEFDWGLDTSFVEFREHKEDFTYTKEQWDYRDGPRSVCKLFFEKGKLVDIQGGKMVFVNDKNKIISKTEYLEYNNAKEINPRGLLSPDLHNWYFPTRIFFIRTELLYSGIRDKNTYEIIMTSHDAKYLDTDGILKKQIKLDSKK